MATTEELEKEILAEMAADPVAYAAGPVNDVITIDGETRVISVPASELLFGVETDKDVERKHFRCPRVVGDGIDLSKHQIYISYITSDSTGKSFSGDSNLYLCEDVAVDDDDITFSWQLSGNVFASAGFISFKVLAAKTDGENVQTRWNTVPAVGTVLMTVPDGMDISETYPDIVTQLLERMESVEKIATEEAMQGYVNTYLEAHPAEIDETLTDPKKAAPASVVGELKEDIDDLKVVTEIKGSKYIQSGAYINGAFENGSYDSSKHFDVTGCKKIKAEIHTDQYYDIYDFVDSSFNVLSFEREMRNDGTIELELSVPKNAKYFVLSGKNIDDSVVVGTFSIKNEETLIEIQPVSVLNGFWHAEKNSFSYLSGYKYYLYDVRKYKRGELKSIAFEYTKAVVLLDENNVYTEDYNSSIFYKEPNYDISLDIEGAAYVGVSVKTNVTPTFTVLTENVQSEEPNLLIDDLKRTIHNITEEITIPGWCKIGYYSGEEHNTTQGVSLFFEIPKHVKQIRVVANGRAYFNDYTFINEDDNIVSYGAKLTQDKDIDVLIDVPSGATKVVVGGKIEDCDSASVFYKATVKKETEAYIKRLIGKRSKIFFTVGVRSEGSVDNSIYYDVANAISITVNGTFEQRKDIATFIDNNGVLVGSVSATVTGSTRKTISVPKKAKTVYISTTYQNLNSAVVFGKYEIEQSNLKGKKIVWIGTSIPAGGKNGIEVADSYPVYIGKMLDATVYNEAVGSSCLHCKNKNRISERNPYGFVENFEGVSRCLTNTLDEMEWIITHYNDTDVFTKNVPSTLSDEDKEFIRSCSYEKKINKYLTENNFPDLWIIDHGHNDTISDAQELQYEPMEMPWEAKTGFYQKGVLKTSAGKHLIEIDVDGFDMVYLSGVFNVGYDIYDIFDADGKVKKFEYANITKTVENLEIDCRGASRVAFSTETDKLETVIIKAKSTENLYCYQGAFDFIVKKIKEFNQKAEIYMIGEYENQLRPAISNYQIKTSERWSFPLFKAWNMYGWSQKKIKCTGYWSDGIWVEDGIERETTFLNRWLPDTIHPHSDKSGEALWYMAKYISAWLKNLIN